MTIELGNVIISHASDILIVKSSENFIISSIKLNK